MEAIIDNAKTGWKGYLKDSPAQVRHLDVFALFSLSTALVLVAYMMMVGTFPFNSFLSALAACVGVFVFTVGLRMQVTDRAQFGGRSQQAAFGDYVLCNIVLFLVTLNFIG